MLMTYGAYSDNIVVKEHFPTRSLQPESRRSRTSPLRWNYSPMRHWGVTKGRKAGIVGLGGFLITRVVKLFRTQEVQPQTA